jgi:hypothetical protein
MVGMLQYSHILESEDDRFDVAANLLSFQRPVKKIARTDQWSNSKKNCEVTLRREGGSWLLLFQAGRQERLA